VEKLGMSDVGITKMRQRLFEDLEAISRGRDPSGVIRDADRAHCVALPIASPETHRDGISTEDMKKHPVLKNRLNGNRWVAGQPDDVYNDFMDAMGWPERKRPVKLKAAE
jgi:5,5'-dehydrodivanillate O-demethylase